MAFLDPYQPTLHAMVPAVMAAAAIRPGESVLELGSGDGRILRAALARGASPVTGYEIDEELARKSAAISPGVRIVCADYENMPWDADVVVAMVGDGLRDDIRARFLAQARGGQRLVLGLPPEVVIRAD